MLRIKEHNWEKKLKSLSFPIFLTIFGKNLNEKVSNIIKKRNSSIQKDINLEEHPVFEVHVCMLIKVSYLMYTTETLTNNTLECLIYAGSDMYA